MQDTSDSNKFYNYFLAFFREALREKVFSSTLAEEEIREIVRDEFLLLTKKQNELGVLPFHNSEINTRTIITSKIGWIKEEGLLSKFYKLLIAHGFIACDFETFRAHFTGNNGAIEPIVWLSYTKQLVYLFDQLLAYKFIPEHKNVHQRLKEHFVDKRGKQLKNGCLRSLLNEVKNNKSIQIIEKIIRLLDENKD